MSTVGKRTQRGLFALAMAAALGFGGTQAFASPGAAAEAERACSGGQCRRDCIQRGYDGGFCDQGGCICIIQVSAADRRRAGGTPTT